MLFNPYSRYLRFRFGRRVAKVPINGGFSCPNRDGATGSDGCAFCDNRSFSPVAMTAASVVEQFLAATARMAGRCDAFIPYLQPFSNTYGPVERLRTVYEPLIACRGVVGLAVGTRPDCLDADILDYLADVNRRTYLSLELGLQSAHDATLRDLCRGHDVASFDAAVAALQKRNIETVAHVILGLPGETVDMMAETACHLATQPVAGVKIHQLMIIAGTELEQRYREGRCAALSLHEYAEALGTFLSCLRPDQLVHRIMADSTAGSGLIAPAWSMQRTVSRETIRAILEKNGSQQGSNHARSLRN